jgi:hypothetical protein
LKPEDQFPGWPKTIHMTENYGRQPVAYLPQVQVTGTTNPVVQVIDDASGEIVYTLRIRGTSFRPKVFEADTTYTLKVGQPSAGEMKVIEGVKPLANDLQGVLKFPF